MTQKIGNYINNTSKKMKNTHICTYTEGNIVKLSKEDFNTIFDVMGDLERKNQELISKIKKLEKEIHLVHMASMFSTVKSFKGDVSKRYRYSEKTDNIYDTANKYGQYDNILDKKEITMLLNEYETLLKEEDENAKKKPL